MPVVDRHRERGVVRLRIALLLTAAVAVACVIWLDRYAVRQSNANVLIVSLDTASNHFRNHLVRRFGEHLESDSGGQLALQIYESAQLMSDRDVSKALALGVIDFAVPADSKIARFDPNAALLSLPSFYGQSHDDVYNIIDGNAGDAVRASVERTLNVQVLEPVIDLGFTATFSTEKDLRKLSDYVGLKVRIPGGTGPAELFEALGAIPIAVPFPDVPLALSQGNLDAIQTTPETARSAKLWDAGLTRCLEDNANLIQYYPMISQQAFDRLSADQVEVLRNAWRRAAADARAESIRFQNSARQVLADHGIECVSLNASEVRELRNVLNERTRRLAKGIGMNMTIVDRALQDLSEERP